MKISLKTIPAYEGYTSSFTFNTFDDCFTDNPLDNIFYTLEYRMLGENPEVKMRGEIERYLFFSFEKGIVPVPPFTIGYYDLVFNKGKDGEDYFFVDIPEVTVATAIHKGTFDSIGKTIEKVLNWVKEEGYEIAGDTRCAITEYGPWMENLPKDQYQMEVQVPVTVPCVLKEFDGDEVYKRLADAVTQAVKAVPAEHLGYIKTQMKKAEALLKEGQPVNDILIDILIFATDTMGKEGMLKEIEWFTQFPHRKTGTEEGLKSAKHVLETFEKLGLEDVEMEFYDSICVECPINELSVDGDDIECFFANGTNREDLTSDRDIKIQGGQVIYLKSGTEADFKGVDVTGKIVVCDVNFKDFGIEDMYKWGDGSELYDPEGKTEKNIRKYDIFTPNDWPFNYERAMAGGATGFIGILHNFMDCHYYHEDYNNIVEMDNYMKLPAVWVSQKDGERIKALYAEKPLTADLHVHTIYAKGEARVVRGVLPGETEDIITIHSHHDAVNRGAVQDGSGMSEVIALADYFSRIPDSLRKKTLMFVATDTHYTDYEAHVGFLERRKENGENIVMSFTIEHIAQEMDLDEDYNIVLTGEAETRMLYADTRNGIYEEVKKAVAAYGLDKTMFYPVSDEAGSVCSDAHDFSASGIPVVSILAAPMYLYHNTDTIEKIHVESLEKVFRMYAYLITKYMQ